MEDSFTCAGAWEEVSEDLDLFAGKWYTKEEFLEMFGDKGSQQDSQNRDMHVESEDRAVELGMPASVSNTGTRQELHRDLGGGKKRNGRGAVQDMDVWGEKLGDIWALQDWNARRLEQQQQQLSAATNAGDEERDIGSRYREAADRLCHVLAMTGPLLMSQLLPAWEAVFPGFYQ